MISVIHGNRIIRAIRVIEVIRIIVVFTRGKYPLITSLNLPLTSTLTAPPYSPLIFRLISTFSLLLP
jgi:hypothetical protein